MLPVTAERRSSTAACRARAGLDEQILGGDATAATAGIRARILVTTVLMRSASTSMTVSSSKNGIYRVHRERRRLRSLPQGVRLELQGACGARRARWSVTATRQTGASGCRSWTGAARRHIDIVPACSPPEVPSERVVPAHSARQRQPSSLSAGSFRSARFSISSGSMPRRSISSAGDRVMREEGRTGTVCVT